MGQNFSLCNNQEGNLRSGSVDLQSLNTDNVCLYTRKQMEQIKEKIFNKTQNWSFDTTKGHVQNIYKNEIVFFWHESEQPKLSFNIKAIRRTATAPFSYFNTSGSVIKLEFGASQDLEEKIYYKTMNYQDFTMKMKQIKQQQDEQITFGK